MRDLRIGDFIKVGADEFLIYDISVCFIDELQFSRLALGKGPYVSLRYKVVNSKGTEVELSDLGSKIAYNLCEKFNLNHLMTHSNKIIRDLIRRKLNL